MQKELKKLDVLFSEYVRKRAIKRTGGCERCGSQKYEIAKENGDPFPAWMQLDCAHLISRWHKATRWNEDIAMGLCGGCNMWIDHEEEEKTDLLKSKIGEEKYTLLKSLPAGKPDINGITLYLKSLLKELGYVDI